jgi:ParB family chromosome partitioning protein
VALVEEDALHDALDGLIESGVLEDDVGRLAAELEREGDLAACERGLDALAHSGRAGERHLVDAVRADEGGARRAVAGDDRDDPRRELGLLADLGEQQRGERRRLGRLEDRGVAAGQRGRELPRRHQEREVPRHDLRDDAQRSRIAPRQPVGQLVRPARVVEEVRGGERDVDVARLADRLAAVHRLHDGQLAGTLLHEPRDPEEVLAALERRQRRPLGLRLARDRDGVLDVRRPGDRHVGEPLLGRGVDRRCGLAAARIGELTADKQPVGIAEPDVVRRLGGRRVVPAEACAFGGHGHAITPSRSPRTGRSARSGSSRTASAGR